MVTIQKRIAINQSQLPTKLQKCNDILERLDEIEGAVHRLETPLAYSENLYAFRQHIDFVRQRARASIHLRAA